MKGGKKEPYREEGGWETRRYGVHAAVPLLKRQGGKGKGKKEEKPSSFPARLA